MKAALTALFLLLPVAAHAATAEEIFAAYAKGDYDQAVKLGEAAKTASGYAIAARAVLADAVLRDRPCMECLTKAEKLSRQAVAADPRHVPLGAPIVVATTDPASGNALVRPMLAQDTGGAIRGPLRFDFFWGFGAEAGALAGRQKYEVRAWLLVPRGSAPEALLRR